jgi:hypothetical protein
MGEWCIPKSLCDPKPQKITLNYGEGISVPWQSSNFNILLSTFYV